jgi:hypothetical protein
MSSIETVAGAATAGAAGLWRLGRALFSWGAAVANLANAVEKNTAATTVLSGELHQLSNTVYDHSERLAVLESKQR